MEKKIPERPTEPEEKASVFNRFHRVLGRITTWNNEYGTPAAAVNNQDIVQKRIAQVHEERKAAEEQRKRYRDFTTIAPSAEGVVGRGLREFASKRDG